VGIKVSRGVPWPKNQYRSQYSRFILTIINIVHLLDSFKTYRLDCDLIVYFSLIFVPIEEHYHINV